MKRTVFPQYNEMVIVNRYDMRQVDWVINDHPNNWNRAMIQFNIADFLQDLESLSIDRNSIYAEIRLTSQKTSQTFVEQTARRLIFDEEFETEASSRKDWIIWDTTNKPLRTQSELMWSWTPLSSLHREVFPVTTYVREAIEQRERFFSLLLEGCSPETVMYWSSDMEAKPTLQIEVAVDGNEWDFNVQSSEPQKQESKKKRRQY